MKRFIITAILLLFISMNVTGQDKWSLTYGIGFPTGETSDFVESTSWRGIHLDYHHFITSKVAVGFGIGWQVFNDDLGYVSQTSGTETLSGFQYNYLNSFPVLVTGSYFFSPSKSIDPYVSLGVGLVYNELTQDIGQVRRQATGWPFSLRPEIGVDFEFDYNFGLRASLRYNYVASGADFPSLSYIGLNLGLVWAN